MKIRLFFSLIIFMFPLSTQAVKFKKATFILKNKTDRDIIIGYNGKSLTPKCIRLENNKQTRCKIRKLPKNSYKITVYLDIRTGKRIQKEIILQRNSNDGREVLTGRSSNRNGSSSTRNRNYVSKHVSLFFDGKTIDYEQRDPLSESDSDADNQEMEPLLPPIETMY